MKHLPVQDKQVFNAIKDERKRQQTKIELIASENFVTEAVMEAQGSVLTNKYAEGYPANATTAAVSMLMSSRTSPATARKRFSELSM